MNTKVSLLRCDRDTDPIYSGLVDLRPVLDSAPPDAWGFLLAERLRADTRLSYYDAGLLKCEPAQADEVESLLADHVEKTNQTYDRHITAGRMRPPTAVRPLQALAGEGFYLPFGRALLDEVP